MRTPRIILGAISLFAAGLCAAAPLPVTDDELAEAQQHFGSFAGEPSLHGAHGFPDGARGEITMALPGRLSIDDRLANEDDMRFHGIVCGAAAIVSATAVDSISFLSGSKSKVFTRSTFTVVDVLKPAAGVETGGVISVTALGGQVDDEGERLRLVNASLAPVVPGASYLLTLQRGSSGDRFYAIKVIALKGDRLGPIGGEWAGFSRDMRTLDEFRARSLAVTQRAPCN
jgi:hypothetical protein